MGWWVGGGGGEGRGGGKCIRITTIRGEREGGWRGEIYVRGEGEEKEDHVFFFEKKDEFFSFTRIDYGHPLSLFLIPILCIDKLSNPHPFKTISSFPLLLFSFLQRLVGGEIVGGEI